ncbi:MAG: thiol-disulfide oxidoreductase DCC family protein [Sphingobacteriales bacterium]|nr:MAG: thiol-disulfide oxidoreductase DCC family protein [Sphingobacteriales bacterium]
METTSKTERIVLFDGVCNLCNSSVQFIIDRDTEGKFKFTSLQSNTGIALMEKFGVSTTNFDTFLLIENNRIYSKSTAALRVVRNLDGLWKLGYAFIVIPAFLRDAVYGFVARNRYRWFGREESCRIPTPELKHRFLT